MTVPEGDDVMDAEPSGMILAIGLYSEWQTGVTESLFEREREMYMYVCKSVSLCT